MNATRMRHWAWLAAFVAAWATTGDEARAQGRILLFAPAVDAKLAETSFHQPAAERLAERLVKAGIPAGQVVRLTGPEAATARFQEVLTELVDAAAKDDLLLVVLCSPGIQVNDVDYVCAADTPADVVAEAAKPEPRLISLAAVAEEMAQSASAKQLLVVDAAGASEGPLADAAARFGRLPVKTAQGLGTAKGQWTIFNRGRHVTARGDQPALTDFMWALLDGLVYHADGNRDGNVSWFELTAYIKLYLEDHQDIAPRIAGKAGEDVILLPTTADKDETFPDQKLQANAQRLVTEAQKALLFDVDVYAALTLLDRANRLCRDEAFKALIGDVLSTARILNGQVGEFLPKAEVPGQKWTAVLPRDCGLYEDGGRFVTKTLPAGTIVELTHASTTSRGYVWAVSASAARWTDKGLELAPIAIKPGEIKASELQAEASKTVPNQYLRQRLLQVTATP